MDIEDICVNHKKSIKEAANIIDHGGLLIACIVDDREKLIGVTTTGDIRSAILSGSNLDENIDKIMNKKPILIKKIWTEKEIFDYLKKEEIFRQIVEKKSMRIPVIDKQGHVVDIKIVTEENQELKIKSFKDSNDYSSAGVQFVQRVLIVGGAGYLGSVLCQKLIDKGYFVIVLDNLMYGDHGIKHLYKNPKFKLIKGDVRNIETVMSSVREVDAVIHLAAIVGDPASALNPLQTIEINYLASKMLAECCKYSQINRFIFASTCSIYGASPNPDKKIDEKSKLNPVSLYAEMKLKSEQGILEIADENFSPTILRMATLYGLSPRMRFDLVVNTLTINALKNKKYSIFGGEQWRPNLHVSDAADAYINCLEQPLSKIKGQIFNVGSDKENFKIIDIGKKIQKIIPESKMEIDDKLIDQRNYNVSFNKIKNQLQYMTKYGIEDGVTEIKEAVHQGKFNDFKDNKYSNYKYLQETYLLE